MTRRLFLIASHKYHGVQFAKVGSNSWGKRSARMDGTRGSDLPYAVVPNRLLHVAHTPLEQA
jgi:hypothetical protein